MIIFLSIIALLSTFEVAQGQFNTTNYEVGTDLNGSFRSATWYLLQYGRNQPAILVITPDHCQNLNVMVLFGNYYQPIETNDGRFIIPLSPTMNNTYLKLDAYSYCTLTLESKYYEETNITYNKAISVELAVGNAQFFSSKFLSTNLAASITVTASQSCVFTLTWAQYIPSLAQYEDGIVSTTTNDLPIYPVGDTLNLLLVSNSTNDASCTFNLTIQEVPLNVISYQNGVTTQLNMTTSLRCLIKFTDFTKNPVGFIINSTQAIYYTGLLTLDGSLDSYASYYTNQIQSQYEFVIGVTRPTSFGLIIILHSPATSDSPLKLTLQEFPPFEIQLNETRSGSINELSWIYYDLEATYDKPQYLTISVLNPEPCVMAFLYLNTENYPDTKSSLQTVSSGVFANNYTLFKTALSLANTGLTRFHIGFNTWRESCDFTFTTYFEPFPTLTNGSVFADITNSPMSMQNFFFIYVITPKSEATYLDISLLEDNYGYGAFVCRQDDIPSFTNYDGHIYQGAGSILGMCMPRRSDQPITFYVEVAVAGSLNPWSHNDDKYNLTVTEVFPTNIQLNISYDIPETFDPFWKFFSLSDLSTEVFALQYDGVVDNMLVPFYYSKYYLPNENSTQITTGSLTKDQVGGSWNNVYVALDGISINKKPFVAYDNGILLEWDNDFLLSVGDSYFWTVIPESAKLVNLIIEYFFTKENRNVDGIYVSWDGAPVNSTNALKVPRQGDQPYTFIYTVPLSLANNTNLYFSIRNYTICYISVDDSITNKVSVDGSKVSTGIVVAYWTYFNIEWNYEVSNDKEYDVTFTLTTDKSDERVQFYYGENSLPTTNSYTQLGNTDGITHTIKLQSVKGSSFQSNQNTAHGYLAIYAGDNGNASSINYSVSAIIKEKNKKLTAGIIIAIVIGSVVGVALLGVGIWKLTQYNRRKRYEVVS